MTAMLTHRDLSRFFNGGLSRGAVIDLALTMGVWQPSPKAVSQRPGSGEGKEFLDGG
ncbi:hypothetical protein EMIT0P294_240001 [Pseudomonas sp. IT-P294]|jgi:hypothetical protein